jgi:hypothetical protein
MRALATARDVWFYQIAGTSAERRPRAYPMDGTRGAGTPRPSRVDTGPDEAAARTRSSGRLPEHLAAAAPDLGILRSSDLDDRQRDRVERQHLRRELVTDGCRDRTGRPGAQVPQVSWALGSER